MTPTPAIPLVAIVGRPNVGKSTLFNALLGEGKKAITYGEPGVTRDRQYALVTLDDEGGQAAQTLVLVDTGGFFTPEAPAAREAGPATVAGNKKAAGQGRGKGKGKHSSAGALSARDHQTSTFLMDGPTFYAVMAAQVQQAVQDADLVLLVFDGREEPLPHDYAIAQYLRQQGKIFWPVANKIDHAGRVAEAHHGRQLGGKEDDFFMISAAHQHGLGELKQRLQAFAKTCPGQKTWPTSILPRERLASRLAIIGAPNVGKSTLLNALLKNERALVSARAGTTMDPVEGHFDLFFGPKVNLLDERPLFPTAQEQLWEEYQNLSGNLVTPEQIKVLLTEEEVAEELRNKVFTQTIEGPSDEQPVEPGARGLSSAVQDAHTNYWRSVQVVDTAGIRKKKLVHAPLEVEAVHKALQALAAAEVVLYVADATVPLGHHDRRLLEIAKEKGKSIILCLNKTDLLRQKFKTTAAQKTWLHDFAEFIPWPNFCEVVPISAAQRWGLGRLKKALVETILVRHQRIPPRLINAALFELVAQQSFIVPRSGGKTFKVRFATMIKSTPPTII
ncbi:MAG: 50S ribosome-binding GTPase, partial [Bacteriovoracaceae bacterium]|nr:50S ribosome-binding GTPase [Bacteriovoracaceae bacterium]